MTLMGLMFFGMASIFLPLVRFCRVWNFILYFYQVDLTSASLSLSLAMLQIMIRPSKFALSFTFGSMCLMTAFAMLKGPGAFLAGLLEPKRLALTTAYFFSLGTSTMLSVTTDIGSMALLFRCKWWYSLMHSCRRDAVQLPGAGQLRPRRLHLCDAGTNGLLWSTWWNCVAYTCIDSVFVCMLTAQLITLGVFAMAVLPGGNASLKGRCFTAQAQIPSQALVYRKLTLKLHQRSLSPVCVYVLPAFGVLFTKAARQMIQALRRLFR